MAFFSCQLELNSDFAWLNCHLHAILFYRYYIPNEGINYKVFGQENEFECDFIIAFDSIHSFHQIHWKFAMGISQAKVQSNCSHDFQNNWIFPSRKSQKPWIYYRMETTEEQFLPNQKIKKTKK